MTDMIDELFHGNLDLSMIELKRGSEYNKKFSEVSTLLDKMEDLGREPEVRMLRDALGDLDLVTSHAYFKVGFQWGARMALAILHDDQDVFSISE